LGRILGAFALKDNHFNMDLSKKSEIKEEWSKENKDDRPNKKKGFSDDFVDGIAAVLLIALVVSGVSYWLHNMP
jgi:hypothetical protein